MKKVLLFIFLMMISFVTVCSTQNLSANESIKYVAIGDSTIADKNSYVDNFNNDYLKASKSKYTKLGKKGVRLEDLLNILDSSFETDEYGKTINLDSEKYINAIKEADVISLSYNNMDYALKQLKMASLKPYTNVWERYFDDEKMSEVNGILNEFRTNLTNSGVPMIDMVILVIESYAYNYVSTVFNYSKVVEKIKELNPKCDILTTKMYNPLNGIIIQIGEHSIDVGMYFNLLIELVDSLYQGPSMESTDSYIVNLNSVETKYTEMLNSAATQPEYMQILTTIISNDTVFLPSTNGKEYIKQQMITTYESVCDHVANADDGDCTTAITCSLCDKVLVDGNEEHSTVIDPEVESTCDQFGLTEGAHCSICNKVIVAQTSTPKKEHTYDNDCDTTCNKCNETRVTNHSYGEWTVSQEATKDQNGEEKHTCTVCGHFETRVTDKIKSNDGLIIATVCCFIGAGLCFLATVIIKRKRK